MLQFPRPLEQRSPPLVVALLAYAGPSPLPPLVGESRDYWGAARAVPKLHEFGWIKLRSGCTLSWLRG